jgi:hypothetical protein
VKTIVKKGIITNKNLSFLMTVNFGVIHVNASVNETYSQSVLLIQTSLEDNLTVDKTTSTHKTGPVPAAILPVSLTY